MRSPGDLSLSQGNLEFSLKCYDLSGNDLELLTLLAITGSKGKSLLNQFMAQSKSSNLNNYTLACCINEKESDVDTSSTALLGVPKRRNALLRVEETEVLPVLPPIKDTKTRITMPNINSRPAGIETKLKTLALEGIHPWIGIPRPLAGDKRKAREEMDGGIESLIANASSGSQSSSLTPLTRLEGEDAVMGYWRFEEEEEKHSDLKVIDLSKNNVTGLLEGDAKYVESTCPCDQGDPKKILKQWALSLNNSKITTPSTSQGMRVPVTKGDNLDIGFGHTVDRYPFIYLSIYIYMYIYELSMLSLHHLSLGLHSRWSFGYKSLLTIQNEWSSQGDTLVTHFSGS
jgi:hypothetical protein